MKTFWVDLETSGTNYKEDSIVQLSVVYEEDNEIKDCLSLYSYPDKFSSNFKESQKIHKLSKEFLLENGVDEAELYFNFVQFVQKYVHKFEKGRAFIGGFRCDFDFKFLIELFNRADDDGFFSHFYTQPLDISYMVAFCVQQGLIEVPKNYKLPSICDMFNIKLKAHNAEDDIIATIGIYKKIIKLLKEYNGK